MEKVFDYVIACSSPKGRISDMKVVEDFESRPHTSVTFVVERGKERLAWNEQKLLKALPGYTVEEDYQEEARKRKVEKKEKKAKEANKGRRN